MFVFLTKNTTSIWSYPLKAEEFLEGSQMKVVGQTLTLGGLLEILGARLLTSATGDRGLESAVSVPVIHDPLDAIPDTPGGILLLVGFTAGDPGLAGVLEEAHRRGFSAVVLKLHGWEPVEGWDPGATLSILVVDDHIPWLHLDNLMTAVVSGRPAGSAASAAEGQDLFVLANALATATDGAVAIEDLDRNVLAYSNLEQHVVDPLRRSGILARQVPDMDKNIDQYRKVMLTDTVVHFPYDDSDGELSRCAAPVRAGRQMLGSIWVIEDRQQLGAEGEGALMEVARLAAVRILRAQSVADLERHVRTEWLRSALEGHGSAPVTDARFGLMAGFRPVLLGFTFASEATATVGGAMADGLFQLPLTRQLRIAAEQYCSIFHTNISSIDVGRVAYVLAPAVRTAEAAYRLADGAVTALGVRLGSHVQVAISSLGEMAGELPQMRREVDEIIAVQDSGSPGGPVPCVATAGEVHAALFMARLGRLVAEDPKLAHPSVRSLLECDALSGTSYRESLCAFFTATGDVAAAARTLNVHANTLRYRIKRAVELFGLRLDDEDEQIALWLQLRLAAPGPGGTQGLPQTGAGPRKEASTYRGLSAAGQKQHGTTHRTSP